MTKRIVPVAVAAAIAVVYLLVEPRTVDLAAATYRAHLFGEAQFTIWNGNWYAGHHTWSYSVLFAPLAWLLGPALTGALATVGATALFEPLARRQFGPRAALYGGVWFAAAAGAMLFSGRIPFITGAAVAVGSLLALQRGRLAVACALAVVSALLSPIAGLFLALAGVAYALSGAWLPGAAVALAALVPPALVSLVFPDGRYGPFSFSAFWPLPLLALGFAAVLPPSQRALRIGAVLYAVAGTAAYLIDTPMGGNAVRLGALVGGPLLLCVLLTETDKRRRTAGAVLLAGFAVWSLQPAIRDVSDTAGDRSTEASFYRPLLGFLQQAGGPPFRVEIPFTFSHWETAEVAPHFPLARGWLRPDDIDYNGLFYGRAPLTATTYVRWLGEHGVRFVAVPRAKPDYSARAELKLIAAGLPYLRPVWRSADWKVYEVTAPHLLTTSRELQVTHLGIDDVTLLARTPAAATVRIRWTPYWRTDGGCVERDGHWTRVTPRHAGELHVRADFSLGRVFDHGRRCG